MHVATPAPKSASCIDPVELTGITIYCPPDSSIEKWYARVFGLYHSENGCPLDDSAIVTDGHGLNFRFVKSNRNRECVEVLLRSPVALEEWSRRLVEAGGKPAVAVEARGRKYIYFEDPIGNAFEVWPAEQEAQRAA